MLQPVARALAQVLHSDLRDSLIESTSRKRVFRAICRLSTCLSQVHRWSSVFARTAGETQSRTSAVQHAVRWRTASLGMGNNLMAVPLAGALFCGTQLCAPGAAPSQRALPGYGCRMASLDTLVTVNCAGQEKSGFPKLLDSPQPVCRIFFSPTNAPSDPAGGCSGDFSSSQRRNEGVCKSEWSLRRWRHDAVDPRRTCCDRPTAIRLVRHLRTDCAGGLRLLPAVLGLLLIFECALSDVVRCRPFVHSCRELFECWCWCWSLKYIDLAAVRHRQLAGLLSDANPRSNW